MANNRTIRNNQLTPDKTYLVRGKMEFCRITRHTTDKEREDLNKRRLHPIDKNYTSVTIYDAQVLAKDPSNPTIEERYAAESLYDTANQTHPTKHFSAMNKSRNLPNVGLIDANTPGLYNPIVPEGEIAQGVDVTLVMRVFKGQGGNNGVSLDTVLVNEPIRYYGGNNGVEKALADFGITFHAAPPQPATHDMGPEDEADTATDASATPMNGFAPVNNNGFAPVNQANQFAQYNQAQPQAPVQGTPVAPDANNNPFSSYAAGPNNITFGPGSARQY